MNVLGWILSTAFAGIIAAGVFQVLLLLIGVGVGLMIGAGIGSRI